MKKNLWMPIAVAGLMLPSVAPVQAATLIEPVMVTIKGGEFTMGNPTPAPFQRGAPSDGPAHAVRLNTFKLSKFELTVKEFRQFVEAANYQPVGIGERKDSCWKWVKPGDGGWAGVPMAVAPGRWNTPAYAPSDYHPAMCVSWQDAQAYVQWLSNSTGKQYRLPSESEWEYAARAGGSSKFASGDTAATLCRYANAWDVSGKAAFLRDLGWDRPDGDCDDGAAYTSVVGMYEANAFGLHDMIGNVSEYVQDCQHKDYVGAPADGSAWTGACDVSDGDDMIMRRGGSYGTRGEGLRFTYRGHSGRDNHSAMGEGIRIAQSVANDVDAPSPNPFEAELAKAQAAERARRARAQGAAR